MTDKSIKKRLQGLANKMDARELKDVFNASLTDYTAGRAEIINLVADVLALAGALDTLATKLNADTGVNDTNFATNNAAAQTALDPAAVTLLK
jgi:hypothetical protein